MELNYILSGVIGVGILVVFSFLIYSDIRYQKLPNISIIVQITLCLLFMILTEIVIEQKSYAVVLIEHLFALFPISGFYLVVYILSKGKLVGLGDIKLGIPIAILLTWQEALITLVLANFIALIVYAPLLITKKYNMNTKISFGQFLIFACLLVFAAVKFFVNFF